MLGQRHVDVAQMVDNLSIDFLWNPLIEASVAGLKMEDRNLAPFYRDDGKATVRIAVKKNRVRLFAFENRIDPSDNKPDGLGRGLARRFQEVIGSAYPQISEKDFVQLVIIVLPRMDDHQVVI